MAALSMHVVLDSALADGDLTRSSVRASAADVGDLDLGFGSSGEMVVGVADVSSPTGVRFVAWVPVEILIP